MTALVIPLSLGPKLKYARINKKARRQNIGWWDNYRAPLVKTHNQTSPTNLISISHILQWKNTKALRAWQLLPPHTLLFEAPQFEMGYVAPPRQAEGSGSTLKLYAESSGRHGCTAKVFYKSSQSPNQPIRRVLQSSPPTRRQNPPSSDNIQLQRSRSGKAAPLSAANPSS